MQLHIASTEAVGELPYTHAASGGGTEVSALPVLRVPCRGLVPPRLEGLLFTSDLQGVAPVPSRAGAMGLLGEAFVDWYAQAADQGHVPAADAVGVVLAGDLFSDSFARKRGATGDVGPVWSAFARDFAWVTGVAGNHDLFTSRISRHVQRHAHVARLDGDTVELDGLRIGGVGGIVGKKGKPNRRPLPAFVDALRRVLAAKPDIVVVHEGPPGTEPAQRGKAELADALRHARAPLLVSGHVHWREPWSSTRASTHLNVDGRVVLLTPE